MTHDTTWLDLKNHMQSERIQSQKRFPIVGLHVYEMSRKGTSRGTESTVEAFWNQVAVNGHEGSYWGNENVLDL